MNYIRNHVYEYTEWMLASNLSHRDGKPKYISKFWTKHGGDGKQWPLTPFPFLAPWPSRPPAIETPPRPVPAGPLISWPKNASCSRIPHRASHASLPPRSSDERRHAIGSHSALALRLYLAACSPSSSCCFWVLDHLCSNLSQSFHLRWFTEIRSLNLCLCFYLFLCCLCFFNRNELQL